MTVLSASALIVWSPAAQADPAVELPDNACNQGTARAYVVSSPNSNSPVTPHGIHGCHVHLPY
jgi:hypothetical protein